jgi:hypothetical protein
LPHLDLDLPHRAQHLGILGEPRRRLKERRHGRRALPPFREPGGRHGRAVLREAELHRGEGEGTPQVNGALGQALGSGEVSPEEHDLPELEGGVGVRRLERDGPLEQLGGLVQPLRLEESSTSLVNRD